mmetsp:Transcript_661/g.814  ORF Transcript_661/g.814 Transcript_661/m.814 type:complete len:400 (-) Transcript_661:153-1352(-)
MLPTQPRSLHSTIRMLYGIPNWLPGHTRYFLHRRHPQHTIMLHERIVLIVVVFLAKCPFSSTSLFHFSHVFLFSSVDSLGHPFPPLPPFRLGDVSLFVFPLSSLRQSIFVVVFSSIITTIIRPIGPLETIPKILELNIGPFDQFVTFGIGLGGNILRMHIFNVHLLINQQLRLLPLPHDSLLLQFLHIVQILHCHCIPCRGYVNHICSSNGRFHKLIGILFFVGFIRVIDQFLNFGIYPCRYFFLIFTDLSIPIGLFLIVTILYNGTDTSGTEMEFLCNHPHDIFMTGRALEFIILIHHHGEVHLVHILTLGFIQPTEYDGGIVEGIELRIESDRGAGGEVFLGDDVGFVTPSRTVGGVSFAMSMASEFGEGVAFPRCEADFDEGLGVAGGVFVFVVVF